MCGRGRRHAPSTLSCMTYIPDLSTCAYFAPSVASPRLVAVGWLEPEHPIVIGPVSAEFVSRLVELLVDPWQPFAFRGRHRCGFCRLTGGPGEVGFRGTRVGIGWSNLFVPAADRVYAAPSMIVHSIDAHGYAPPDEFIAAVLACPPMRSIEYLRQLKSGCPELVEAVQRQA